MKRRLMAGLTAVLVAVGLSFAIASPAHASFTWCLAFSSQICMAEHHDGNGARVADSGPIGACQPLGGFWNDRISSIKNTFPVSLDVVVVFWHDAGCDSIWHNTLRSGDTRNLDWIHNDEFSSFCIGSDSRYGSGCFRF